MPCFIDQNNISDKESLDRLLKKQTEVAVLVKINI